MIRFEDIGENDKQFGGKAWGLGRLAQAGFPVPPGVVLDHEPDENEWLEIVKWWKSVGAQPLAVRSSAGAEDSATTSFAGQNRTFLNVTDECGLKEAVLACFQSIHGDNSRAYRRFFSQDEAGRMNVVLQVMVQPRFAGVFFSLDPISPERGWLFEVVEGLGEDLVSGRVTPGLQRQNGEKQRLPADFTADFAGEVAKCGTAVRDAMGFELDMEWAFDANGKFHVLQARPITATARESKVDHCQRELDRLKRAHPSNVTWDGQTFSEWAGLPSVLTYSVWRRAFSPRHAFGNALKELGYRGFSESEWKDGESLLERVFGRAYINLDRLSDLYYGDIPYRIEPRPRPHTEFEWQKLGFHSFIHFPGAAFSMMKVGWTLATKRKHYYQRCFEELSLFRHRFARPLSDDDGIKALTAEALTKRIAEEVEEFSSRTLMWPLVLVVLTEATTQSLRNMLIGVFGEADADRELREWTGKGLHTATLDMQREFSRSCQTPALRQEFLARYGHRGPGEMDLSHPRWFEIGEKAFMSSTSVEREWTDHSADVEAEILAIPSFKREMILEEWRLLKKLLETREAWKMELLRPYAYLRLLVREFGSRSGLGENVHWCYLEELLSPPTDLQERIKLRKEQEAEFGSISLPDYVTLERIAAILDGDVETEDGHDGEPLSPGIAFGEVRVVRDPLEVDLASWPESTILVATSTDPGWTPLFAKAKGIVVERGGVLSHCAILAREMGIPAIGGIMNAQKRLKDGDRLWVDGNHGRIRND